MELSNGLLLSKLFYSNSVFLNLLHQSVVKPYQFTYSSVVFLWLHTQPYNLKTFVANCLVEIIELTSYSFCHHIVSKENPANCGSCGLLPEQLLTYDLWWSGPSWLAYQKKS